MPTTNQEVPVEGSVAAGRKPFAQLVQEQGRGVLHDRLSEKLAEIVQAVVETGKKGSLTLKLDISLNKDGETLTVSDSVTAKVPDHDTKPSIFYADGNGNLSRNNPSQPELPLRDVSAKRGDNDEAAAAAGEAG
jgi:hypothetical protein